MIPDIKNPHIPRPAAIADFRIFKLQPSIKHLLVNEIINDL